MDRRALRCTGPVSRDDAAGREIGQAFRELIGSYNAAMTAVEVTALMEDRAKVEIEATAVIPLP